MKKALFINVLILILVLGWATAQAVETNDIRTNNAALTEPVEATSLQTTVKAPVTESGTAAPVPDDQGRCPSSYVLASQDGGKVCLKPVIVVPTSSAGGSGGGTSSNEPTVKSPILGSGTAPIVPIDGKCPDPNLWQISADGKTCLKTKSPSIFLGGQGSGNQNVEVAAQGGLTIFTVIDGKTISVAATDDGVKKFIGSGTYNAKPDCPLYLSLCKGGDENSCSKYAYNCEKPDTTVTAETKEEVKVKNDKVYVNDKELKVMPDTASEKALTVLGEKYDKIELKDTGDGKSTYEVSSSADAKLLGLVKVKLTTTVEVDGDTGEIVKTSRPWWRFLAF